MMTVRDAGNLIIYAGAIAAALASIAIVARFAVLLPLRKWVSEQITERIAPPLQRVQDEVTNDSGTSLKDAVGRTETAVRVLSSRLDDHLLYHHRSTE